VNGGFEEGPPVGNYRAFAAGSTDIKGWVVTRASVDVVGPYWPAAEGKRSIDLHGSPGLGGLSQAFATKPGRSYLVTFSLAGNPDGAVPKKLVGVSAAGRSAAFPFDATGKSLKDMGWVRKSWRFKAQAAKTTLEIYTLMKNDDSCGPVIDDVRVVED